MASGRSRQTRHHADAIVFVLLALKVKSSLKFPDFTPVILLIGDLGIQRLDAA